MSEASVQSYYLTDKNPVLSEASVQSYYLTDKNPVTERSYCTELLSYWQKSCNWAELVYTVTILLTKIL